MEDNRKEEAGDPSKKSEAEQVAQNRIGKKTRAKSTSEPKAKRQKLGENGEKMMKDSGEEEKHAEDSQIATSSEQKKQIWMSVWVWLEVLKFITRKEIGDRVSLTSFYIKDLCSRRLHDTPHWVEKTLRFEKELFEKKATLGIYGRGEFIPIAIDCPPPKYIQGFRRIQTFCLNPEVLRFIHNIKPLLANLHVSVYSTLKFRSLLTALNGCSIACLDLSSASNSIYKLRQAFPGLLETIPTISVEICIKWDNLALNEVIMAKLGSGKSFVIKIFYWTDSLPIDDIKKAFHIASQPQSFFFAFGFGIFSDSELQVFQVENQTTGEVLALEKERKDYELYRCPAGEIEQWRKEAKKLLEEENYKSCIDYCV